MDSEPVGGTYIVVEQYDGSIDEGLVLNSGDTVEILEDDGGGGVGVLGRNLTTGMVGRFPSIIRLAADSAAMSHYEQLKGFQSAGLSKSDILNSPGTPQWNQDAVDATWPYDDKTRYIGQHFEAQLAAAAAAAALPPPPTIGIAAPPPLQQPIPASRKAAPRDQGKGNSVRDDRGGGSGGSNAAAAATVAIANGSGLDNQRIGAPTPTPSARAGGSSVAARAAVLDRAGTPPPKARVRPNGSPNPVHRRSGGGGGGGGVGMGGGNARSRNSVAALASQLNLDVSMFGAPPSLRRSKSPDPHAGEPEMATKEPSTDADGTECTICRESRPAHKFLPRSCAGYPVCEACTHVCAYCCAGYVRVQLERPFIDAIACMYSDIECNGFHLPQISAIRAHTSDHPDGLSDDHYSTYCRLIRIAKYLQNPNFRWCATPDCGDALIHDGGSDFRMKCTTCANFMCFNHERDHPGRTCAEVDVEEEAAAEAARVTTANGLLEGATRIHTKDCPKCSVSIEKTGGCRHMTCTACKHEFFWCCLRGYRDPAGAKLHRQECP